MVAWSALLVGDFQKYFGACELTVPVFHRDTEFHAWSCNPGFGKFSIHFLFGPMCDGLKLRILRITTCLAADLQYSFGRFTKPYQTHIYPSSTVSLCLWACLLKHLQRYNSQMAAIYMPSQLGTVGFEDFLLWVWQCIFMEETLGIA